MKIKITIILGLISLMLVINSGLLWSSSPSIFTGKWKYEQDNYEFVINIKGIQNDQIDGYYTIVSNDGQQMDIPFEDEKNIIFVSFQQSDNILEVKLISQLDFAVYKARLRKIDNNRIEFELGEVINEGAHIFPYRSAIEMQKLD